MFLNKIYTMKVFTNRELNVARSRADDIQWKPIQNILDEKFLIDIVKSWWLIYIK